MDGFYITVLVIAAVALVLVLAAMGILIAQPNTNAVYPPVANQCPNLWTISPSDPTKCQMPTPDSTNSNNVIPYSKTTNMQHLSCDASNNCYVDPTSTSWLSNGLSAVCSQKQWANTHGIIWDGVSNYNGC